MYPNSWENVILKGQFLLGMEKSFHIWGFPIPTSLNLLGNGVENRSEIFNGVGNRLGKTLGPVRVWCYPGPNRMTKIDTQTWAKPGFCMCGPGSSPACPRFGLIRASKPVNSSFNVFFHFYHPNINKQHACTFLVYHTTR